MPIMYLYYERILEISNFYLSEFHFREKVKPMIDKKLRQNGEMDKLKDLSFD
jgi:hypothetical protein